MGHCKVFDFTHRSEACIFCYAEARRRDKNQIAINKRRSLLKLFYSASSLLSLLAFLRAYVVRVPRNKVPDLSS
jgi:hypothetical protein